MKVETYEIEEVTGELGNMAADSEAAELVAKLGLTGQQTLMDPDTETRFPYREMTAQEKLVFELHCPQKTKLEDYKSGIIPLRVLQVAAFCKDMSQVKFMEVWHPQDARLDPVLVGRTDGWGGKFYLLARWGEVWKDLPELVSDARPILLAKMKVRAVTAAREAQSFLDVLEERVDECLQTGKELSINFYAH